MTTQLRRMTGVWEIESGPSKIHDDTGAAMLALLRRITEAIPADTPLHGMTVEVGDFRWRFRRLGVLTLLEGPDGGYAVLNQEPSEVPA